MQAVYWVVNKRHESIGSCREVPTLVYIQCTCWLCREDVVRRRDAISWRTCSTAYHLGIRTGIILKLKTCFTHESMAQSFKPFLYFGRSTYQRSEQTHVYIVYVIRHQNIFANQYSSSVWFSLNLSRQFLMTDWSLTMFLKRWKGDANFHHSLRWLHSYFLFSFSIWRWFCWVGMLGISILHDVLSVIC